MNALDFFREAEKEAIRKFAKHGVIYIVVGGVAITRASRKKRSRYSESASYSLDTNLIATSL
jgi:hypothetical protein